MKLNLIYKDIDAYITDCGFIPACPTICIDKMRYEYELKGKRQFDFFVNVHNLCWYADDAWKKANPDQKLFTISQRDFKLNEILS